MSENSYQFARNDVTLESALDSLNLEVKVAQADWRNLRRWHTLDVLSIEGKRVIFDAQVVFDPWTFEIRL